ncbi:MAG: DinB family protein [Planctomycetota bacterium]
MSTARLAPAIERIRFSRRMTVGFLDDLQPDDWFWQPAEGMNHIGWHVGHLAFAMYFLCLKRLRDRTVEDESLISTRFLKRYKRESKPDGDPANNFTPDELRAVFDGVFEQVMRELPGYTDAELDVPSSPPHPLFDTKLGAVEWCSQHELMHLGQIMLLRRLSGRPPAW